MDKQPNEWITFNDNLNTKLLLDIYYSEKVTLIDDELPIMKCELENSYILITTDRIISIIDDLTIVCLLDQIDGLINDYESDNFKKKMILFPKYI